MEGRELLKAINHGIGIGEELVKRLERVAVANEKLIELATEERDIELTAAPPHCPHCGAFNPNVRSEGGAGSLADFILVAQCGNCGEVLYGLPESWQMARNAEEAAAIRSERAGE